MTAIRRPILVLLAGVLLAAGCESASSSKTVAQRDPLDERIAPLPPDPVTLWVYQGWYVEPFSQAACKGASAWHDAYEPKPYPALDSWTAPAPAANRRAAP